MAPPVGDLARRPLQIGERHIAEGISASYPTGEAARER
jgi:hypothetical protein